MELNEFAKLLWENENLWDHPENFPYLASLKLHPHVADKPAPQKYFSFLSLFLQTEERILLSKIEEFLTDNDRDMDVYVHDGGLVRKFAADRKMQQMSSHSKPEYKSFHPAQFSSRKISDFHWEASFPQKLLRECESCLRQKRPLQYGYINLIVKPFDEKWKERIHVPVFPPLSIPKTYQELKYYYEENLFLRQLDQDAKFIFKGHFYTVDQLPQIFREKYYYTDIINDLEGTPPKIQHKRNNSQSVSFTRSESQTKEDNLVKGSPFWPRWKDDPTRLIADKILFTLQEKTLPQTKIPTENLKNNKIEDHYVILFEGRNSFDIVQKELAYNYLYELFDRPEETTTFDKQFLKYINDVLRFRDELGEYEIIRATFFLKHLYLLCGKKEAEFVYLVKYIAKLIQNPNVKDEGSGLILYSEEEGVGKSFLAQMIIDLLSPFAKETHEAKDAFGQFGILQENCFLIHFEDGDASELKLFRSHFKNRNTAKTITIEKKYHDKKSRLNLCRHLLTTNNLDGLPISENDRRFAIIPCSRTGDKDYFKILDQKWASIENRKCTFLFLEAINIKGFSCENEKPNNSLLKRLRTRDISSLKRFMIGVSFWMKEHEHDLSGKEFKEKFERRVNCEEMPEFLKRAVWMRSKDLYEIYLKWCEASNIKLGESSKKSSKKQTTLQIFSREVRTTVVQVDAKNDTRGIACLAVCVEEWRQEAQKFDMNAIEDVVALDTLGSAVKRERDQLEENLPGCKGKKIPKPRTSKPKDANDGKKENANKDPIYIENSENSKSLRSVEYKVSLHFSENANSRSLEDLKDLPQKHIKKIV